MMKTLVALSGGPKSLVTAWLLKKQGMQVRGVHLDLFSNPGLKEKMHDLEKKLGIPIQVIDVSQEFGAVCTAEFEEFLKRAIPFRPGNSFHQRILFPQLMRLKAEWSMDRIATGHPVPLQEDPAAGLVRVMTGLSSGFEGMVRLAGLTQEELSVLLAPIGAIPLSMLQKLADELAPAELTAPFETDWEGLGTGFAQANAPELSRSFQVYTSEGMLLDSMERSRLFAGMEFPDPLNAERNYRVIEVHPNQARAIVMEGSKVSFREFEFDRVRWFSRGDLGLRSLETGMIWGSRTRPVPIRVIQYEGGKLKGVLSEPLTGAEADVFRGDTVFWLNGMEVLGAGRVLSAR